MCDCLGKCNVRTKKAFISQFVEGKNDDEIKEESKQIKKYINDTGDKYVLPKSCVDWYNPLVMLIEALFIFLDL